MLNTLKNKKCSGVIAGLTRNPLNFCGMLKKVQHDVKVLIITAVIGLCSASCGNWLDVVPEGVPTIDMAFNSRVQTLKYLATCYSHMPRHANPNSNPALAGCDELWYGDRYQYFVNTSAFRIATGLQNATSPILGTWGAMYQALRDCNTFIDNVYLTPDITEYERDMWIAEVKVLKAYYHFCLVQMYGPVPIIRESLPVDVDITTIKVVRDPVDECFQYIVELLDEAINSEMLTLEIFDPDWLGHITLPIAAALKAKVLVTAASPLYNGNNDQATLQNLDGKKLFNATVDPTKWQAAVTACREAIDICHEANLRLFYYDNFRGFTDTIATDMSLRCAFSERWNPEIIWANTQSTTAGSSGLQTITAPKLNPAYPANTHFRRVLGPPLKIASMFYTRHGVPLEEDKTINMDELYNFRTATEDEGLYIKTGRTTIELHFDREPRFYAWMGFDGGIWFGAGKEDDQTPDLWATEMKIGEADGTDGAGMPTGYYPKKYQYYSNQIRGINAYSDYTITNYPWPIMRLSELYLLYAEAINEAEGPDGANSADMFQYIDLVRERAGLRGVKVSWDDYASPKYATQPGMRQIIQRERMIELCFEGHRFWDIRRWKIAPELYREPIEGWDVRTSINDGTESEVNQMFYTRQFLFQQRFGVKDYFWPLVDADLTINPNLVQNIGW